MQAKSRTNACTVAGGLLCLDARCVAKAVKGPTKCMHRAHLKKKNVKIDFFYYFFFRRGTQLQRRLLCRNASGRLASVACLLLWYVGDLTTHSYKALRLSTMRP